MSLHPHDELEMLDQFESYQRRRETINNVGASLADRMTNPFFPPSDESSSRLPQPASPPQPTPSPQPASSLTPASTPLSSSPQQSMLLNLTAPPPYSSPPAPTSASLLSSPVPSPRHTPYPPVVLTPPESPPASLSSILVASPPQMPPHVYLTQPSHETRPPLLRSVSSPSVSLLSSVTSFPPPSTSSAPSSPSFLPRSAVIQPSIEQEAYTFKSYKASPHSTSPIFVNVFFHANYSTEPACDLSSCQLSPPISPTFMDYFFPNLLYPLSHNITDNSDPEFVSGLH